MASRGWRIWRRSRRNGVVQELEGPLSETTHENGPGSFGRSPDVPIRVPSDDRLRRASFSRAMAEDIRHAPRGAGFVIALTGGWGEGKTSVINLVTEELRDEIDVVHFNPWLFSGTHQLVEHFFEELTAQLQETGRERLQRIAKALDAYGRVVAPLTFFPWVGDLARSSRAIASTVSKTLETDQPSARARARELRHQLSRLDRRIVVIVDDLDRLRPDEIVDVMRLVRLLGTSLISSIFSLLTVRRSRTR